MNTVKIGLVGPYGVSKEERNPAASMYFHDMIQEMGKMDELQGKPFKLHWITEVGSKESDVSKKVPGCVTLEPTWTLRNYFFSIPMRLRKIKADLIEIHHEPFLFSNTLFHSFAFIVMLCLVKLLNRNSRLILILATVYAGKMPKDMARQSPLPASITDIVFKILFRILLHTTDAIMVAKAAQEEILIQHYGAKPDSVYVVLSYTMKHRLDMDKNEARKQLSLDENSYIILNFGCLSYYKGLEQLLPAFYQELKLDKDAVLVIAGGAHPRLSFNRKYHKFIEGIKLYARKNDAPSKRSIFTGFVPSEKVSVYFAAADIAVMPYTSHIASSAVLFDAISYEKPIVMTKPILEHDLLNDEITMIDSPEPILLATKIRQILTDRDIRARNLEIVRRVKEDRLIHKTATQMVDMYKAELAKMQTHIARHPK
ncbi:glycosyltransferase [Chloroflexota bacterium]